VKTLDKRAILAAALVAIAVTAIFAMQASAGTPASKMDEYDRTMV